MFKNYSMNALYNIKHIIYTLLLQKKSPAKKKAVTKKSPAKKKAATKKKTTTKKSPAKKKGSSKRK